MGTSPEQILPPGVWLFRSCTEYISFSYRQGIISLLRFLPSTNKLKTSKQGQINLRDAFFTLLGVAEGAGCSCSSGEHQRALWLRGALPPPASAMDFCSPAPSELPSCWHPLPTGPGGAEPSLLLPPAGLGLQVSAWKGPGSREGMGAADSPC